MSKHTCRSCLAIPGACCARLPLPPISHSALTALAVHTLRPHCWDCSPVPDVHSIVTDTLCMIVIEVLSRLVPALPTNLPNGDEPLA